MEYDFCFLYHPHLYETQPDAQIGLGLLSLATYAKKLGANVRVINAQGDSIATAIIKIPDCKNLMLYGCMVDAPIINEIIEYEHKRKRIYVGGPIAKSLHLLHPNVTGVIEGLGEDFIEYLIQDKREWEGLLYFLTLNRNINMYPFPDRSLLKGKYGGNIFRGIDTKVSTTILTSRGCKFKCAFCTSGADNFYQYYEMDRIGKELESCLSLGIKHFRISDDNLVIDQNRLAKLCSLFKEAGVVWRASVRTYPFSFDMYETMAKSGCRELSFGIESGDQDVLDVLHKGTNVVNNTEAVITAKKAGIQGVRALIMMGTPGETPVTLARNIEWVAVTNPDIVSLKMFVPYPDTDIYNNPTDYGCHVFPIGDANNSAYRPDGSEPHAHITTCDMTRSELTDQFKLMKFYLEKKGLENRG